MYIYQQTKKKSKMATLTSRQTTLASGLIDKGYEMTEFKTGTC
jgi:hypothetical protein